MTSCTDKHGAATRAAAQKAFEAINAAHSTLSDPLRRRRYDEELAFGDGIFRGAPSYASAPRRVLRVEVPCQLEVLLQQVGRPGEAYVGAPPAGGASW